MLDCMWACYRGQPTAMRVQVAFAICSSNLWQYGQILGHLVVNTAVDHRGTCSVVDRDVLHAVHRACVLHAK
eukprot:350320-Chlamydomonas_euryale.AAC.3